MECIYHYVGEEDNGFAYVYDLAGNGAESVSENDNERDTINTILNEMVEELPPWDHCTSVGEIISSKFMEHISVEGTLQCEDGRHIQVDNIHTPLVEYIQIRSSRSHITVVYPNPNTQVGIPNCINKTFFL